MFSNTHSGKYIRVTAVLLLLANLSFGQARTSVGFGAGINIPVFASGYNLGQGYNLQATARISNAVGIVPTIGYEKLDVKTPCQIYYGPNNYSWYSFQDLGVLYFGLSGKYYFSNRFFVRAGPLLYLGFDNDLKTGGIGGTFAAGYELPVTQLSNLELTFRTDIMDLNGEPSGGTKPVLGIRAAFNFNFRKL